MEIAGIKKYKTKKVFLNEFFDVKITVDGEETGGVYVEVRPYPPYTREKINELQYGNMKYHADKTSNLFISADTALAIRKLKLSLGCGVESHNISDTAGRVLDWTDDLWKELDKFDPRILQKVVKAIDEINTVETENENPT